MQRLSGPQKSLTSPPLYSASADSDNENRPPNTSVSSGRQRLDEARRRKKALDDALVPSKPPPAGGYVPRAPATRMNNVDDFLRAMFSGIVLLRHRPRRAAQYIKISSPDNGDTILFTPVDEEEAKSRMMEQRVRYGRAMEVAFGSGGGGGGTKR